MNGYDFIVPAKSNLLVTKRLKKEAKEEDFDKINKDLEIKLVKEITDAPNYDGKLQAIVVKDKKAKKIISSVTQNKNESIHNHGSSHT